MTCPPGFGQKIYPPYILASLGTTSYAIPSEGHTQNSLMMPSTTSSPEYDALVNDVSAQMANSQLSRMPSRSSSHSGGQSRGPARIEKSRSTHTSPKVLERRRTITAVKRYATLDDHFNMMFGSSASESNEDVQEDRRPITRPLSWHPSSSKLSGNPESQCVSEPPPSQGLQDYSHEHSGWDDTELESQQNQATIYSSGLHFRDQTYFSTSPTTYSDYSKTPEWYNQVSIAGFTVPVYSSLSVQSPAYLQQMQAYQTSPPPSVDFLPIQYPQPQTMDVEVSSEEGERKETDKELVGMGLYDPPEGFSLLSSGLSQGKGLKLEETFQPLEQDEEDQDADDASEDEEEVEEPPKPTMDDHQWSVNSGGQQFPTNMAGQSFFFEEDETYTNEWWFHQLKRPVAQEAVLGYGWL